MGIQRTTRECTLDSLNPILRRAFEEYFQRRKLGALKSETCRCSETVTDRSGGGWISRLDGAPPVDYLGLILTEQRLLWARAGGASAPIVMDAQLKDIVARPYAARLYREAGLEIAGNVGEQRDVMRGKFALGGEPAANDFIDAVVQAVNAAAPPPKSLRDIPWLSWLRRK